MKTTLRVLLTLCCLPLIACIQFNELHGQRGEIIVRTVDWKPKSTRLPVGFTTEFDFVTHDHSRPDGVTLAPADPLRLEIISSEWDRAKMRAMQAGPCDLLFLKNGKEIDRVTFDAADVTELPLFSKNRALRVVAGSRLPRATIDRLDGDWFGDQLTMAPELEGGLVPLDEDLIAINTGTIHYEAGTASIDITVEVAALEQMSSLVLKAGEPTAAPSLNNSRLVAVPLEIRAVDATGEWRGVPCQWQVSKEDSIVTTGYTTYDREDISLLMPSGRTRTVSCRTGKLVSQELTITVPAAP